MCETRDDAPILLDIYISSRSPRHSTTLALIDDLRVELARAGGVCRITDVSTNRATAAGREVLATPMVVRTRPTPVLRLVGDFNSAQDLCNRLGLNLGPVGGWRTGADRLRAQLAHDYLRSILAGEERTASSVLDEGLLAGTDAVKLMTDVIAAAMVRVGTMWASGMLSVADEHMATAAAIASLPVLADSLSQCEPPVSDWPAEPRHALFATVDGEVHTLGLQMASQILHANGFSTCLLGASVPAADLVAAIGRQTPTLVALSCTLSSCRPALINTIAAIRDSFPSLPILLGGSACTQLKTDRLTFTVTDLGELCTLLEPALSAASRRRHTSGHGAGPRSAPHLSR